MTTEDWAKGRDMPRQSEPLNEQISRLARVIMDEIPGEPSQSEGAADCAIRLLRAAYNPINTPEQPGEALWPAELISQPVLIQLNPTTWINPQHVVAVDLYPVGGMQVKEEVIVTVGQRRYSTDLTLTEVVALINGDQP